MTLRQRYLHFNKTVFGNELPSNFPIKRIFTGSSWAVTKPASWSGGVIGVYITKQGYQQTLDGPLEYLTPFQVDQILLHEMIHVKMMHEKTHSFDPKEMHGQVFDTLRKSVSDIIGYYIPVYTTEIGIPATARLHNQQHSSILCNKHYRLTNQAPLKNWKHISH